MLFLQMIFTSTLASIWPTQLAQRNTRTAATSASSIASPFPRGLFSEQRTVAARGHSRTFSNGRSQSSDFIDATHKVMLNTRTSAPERSRTVHRRSWHLRKRALALPLSSKELQSWQRNATLLSGLLHQFLNLLNATTADYSRIDDARNTVPPQDVVAAKSSSGLTAMPRDGNEIAAVSGVNRDNSPEPLAVASATARNAHSYRNSTYNVTEESFPLQQSSAFEASLIIIAGGLLSIVTAGGNLMVLISFKIDKQLQTLSNYFLLSLAVADLAIGLVSCPLMTIYTVKGEWTLGYAACQFWLSVDYLMSNASVLNLLLISFDRYFSVTKPLTYRPRRTARKAMIAIAATYVVSLLLWPPWIVAWPYIEGKFIVPPNQCMVQFFVTNPYVTIGTSVEAFYLPVLIMIVLYARIYYETRKRQRDVKHLQAGFSRRMSKKGRKAKASSASIVNSIMATAASSIISPRLLQQRQQDDDNPQTDRDSADTFASASELPATAAAKTGSERTQRVDDERRQSAASTDKVYCCVCGSREKPLRSAHSSDQCCHTSMRSCYRRSHQAAELTDDAYRCASDTSSEQTLSRLNSVKNQNDCVRTEAKAKMATLATTDLSDCSKRLFDHHATEIVESSDRPRVHNISQQTQVNAADGRKYEVVPAEELEGSRKKASNGRTLLLALDEPTEHCALLPTENEHGIRMNAREMTSLQALTVEEEDSFYKVLLELVPRAASFEQLQRLQQQENSDDRRYSKSHDYGSSHIDASASMQQTAAGLPASAGIPEQIRLPAYSHSETEQAANSQSFQPVHKFSLDHLAQPAKCQRATRSGNRQSAAPGKCSNARCRRCNEDVPAGRDLRRQNSANSLSNIIRTAPKLCRQASQHLLQQTSHLCNNIIVRTPSSAEDRTPVASLQINQRQENKQVRKQTSQQQAKKQNEKKQESKAAKTLSAILLAFIITWAPYNVLVCMSAMKYDLPEALWTFSYYLCYLNSTINPICYALCNANFRKTYLRILKCKWSDERTSRKKPEFQRNLS